MPSSTVDRNQACEERGKTLAPFIYFGQMFKSPPSQRDSNNWKMEGSGRCTEYSPKTPNLGRKNLQTRGEGSGPCKGMWLHAQVALGPLLTPLIILHCWAPFSTWWIMNWLLPLPQKKTGKRGLGNPRHGPMAFSGFPSQRR